MKLKSPSPNFVLKPVVAYKKRTLTGLRPVIVLFPFLPRHIRTLTGFCFLTGFIDYHNQQPTKRNQTMNTNTRERQISTLADDMAQSVNLLLIANEAALGNDSHEYCHWLTVESAIAVCAEAARVVLDQGSDALDGQ